MCRLRIDAIPDIGNDKLPKRLMRRLINGVSRRLVTVCGAPGSGKTTLLSCFARWLESDYGVTVLWARVVGFPSEGDITIREALERDFGRVHGSGGDVRAVYLFIEDADKLEDEEQVRALQDALENALPHIHFVLSCTSELPLCISRLRLQGGVLEIQRSEMMLTSLEFRNAMSRNHFLGGHEADRLYEITLGWVAGISICETWLEDGLSIDEVVSRLSRPNLTITDFLIDEVFSRVNDKAMNFIRCMRFFESFTSAMAIYCASLEDVESSIAELLSYGVILEIPESNERGEVWFRFHPLFRPCLRTAARSHLSIEEGEEIVVKGLAWLEREGKVLSALYLADSERLDALALGVLQRHFYTVLVTCDMKRLYALLKRAVCKTASERACQCLASAWVMFVQGNARRASIWLKRYDSVVEVSSIDTVFKGTAQIYEAIKVGIDVFSGHYDEALARGEALLDKIGGPQLFLRSTVMHNMGEAYERTGHYAEALESFFFARSTASLSGRREVMMLCDCEITWLYFIQGKLETASNVALRSISRNVSGDNRTVSWSVGVLYSALARIYLQWGEIDHVRAYLDKTRGLFSSERNRDGYFEVQLTRARCFELEGKLAEASELMAGLYELVSVDRVPRGIDFLVLITYADCLVDIRRLSFASRVLDEAQARMDIRDAFYLVHSNLVRARILIVDGRLDDAEELLRESLSRAESSGLGLLVSDCKVRLACTLRQKEEVEESHVVMTEALNEAASENRLYLFRNALPCQEVLLREIAFPTNSNRILQEYEKTSRDYARRVLEYFGGNKDSDLASEETVRGDRTEELSKREREIFELLRQGKTRREIADALGIKVNTVRTHARSIYRKLGVHNKYEL